MSAGDRDSPAPAPLRAGPVPLSPPEARLRLPDGDVRVSSARVAWTARVPRFPVIAVWKKR